MFKRTSRGHVLVLNVHVLGLTILNTRANGHRDIEADKASAVTLYSAMYKFKNGRY